MLTYSVRAVRMRWPAFSGIDANATSHATVALCTRAISSRWAPTSVATESYTASTRSVASASASYGPISASRRRCATTVSVTTCGRSAPPALFRWATCSTPGVSARTRSRSIVTRGV